MEDTWTWQLALWTWNSRMPPDRPTYSWVPVPQSSHGPSDALGRQLASAWRVSP
jgi:hypothetical protein